MSFLSKLFGGKGGAAELQPLDEDAAMHELEMLYDDPGVRSEWGLSITGPEAVEVRTMGRRLYKGGGKARMMAVRNRVRDKYSWAAKNLEAIWSDVPEWKEAE